MTNTPNSNAQRFIRRDEVTARTGLPRSSIYDRMKAGTFLRRSVLESVLRQSDELEPDISDWISEQIAISRKAA